MGTAEMYFQARGPRRTAPPRRRSAAPTESPIGKSRRRPARRKSLSGTDTVRGRHQRMLRWVPVDHHIYPHVEVRCCRHGRSRCRRRPCCSRRYRRCRCRGERRRVGDRRRLPELNRAAESYLTRRLGGCRFLQSSPTIHMNIFQSLQILLRDFPTTVSAGPCGRSHGRECHAHRPVRLQTMWDLRLDIKCAVCLFTIGVGKAEAPQRQDCVGFWHEA